MRTSPEGSQGVSLPPRRFRQALTAFVALPGVVGFLVPWLLRPRAGRLHPAGAPLLVIGAGLLLWCVRDFYVAGRGTLAPWAPPERLVTVGLYRVSRNPMYVAVLVILAGWAVLFGTAGLWAYAGAVAVAFHLRVVLAEEPWLARRYREEWEAYRARVPRWLRASGSSARALALTVVAVGVTACESGSSSGCVIGPCDTSGGDSRTPVVSGFPSARVFAGVGRLAVGDEVTLYAVRIGRAQDPCTGADTLRSDVQWGVSNPAAATVTPLGNGGVRLRAVGQGSFQMLMREGGSGPLSPSFDVKIVFPCPTGASFSSIGVSP